MHCVEINVYQCHLCLQSPYKLWTAVCKCGEVADLTFFFVVLGRIFSHLLAPYTLLLCQLFCNVQKLLLLLYMCSPMCCGISVLLSLAVCERVRTCVRACVRACLLVGVAVRVCGCVLPHASAFADRCTWTDASEQ